MSHIKDGNKVADKALETYSKQLFFPFSDEKYLKIGE
jgi:hypothetical protein